MTETAASRSTGVMNLDDAIALATRLHHGVTDKAGLRYITHPLRVMERVTTNDQKLAAVLHDVIEDTEFTAEDLLRAGCPAKVVAAIEALSRREEEPYEDFVRRAAADPIARVVKLADIADNLDPERMARLDSAEAGRLRAKYEPAQQLLLGLKDSSSSEQ